MVTQQWPDPNVTTPEPPKHELPGGATRSEQKPGYHLIPMEGLVRTAKRFDLGAEKHGPFNWMRSTHKEGDAYAFCASAYNHMMDHALRMRQGVDNDDDHLGAIGWAVMALSYVEAKWEKKWITLDPKGETVRL